MKNKIGFGTSRLLEQKNDLVDKYAIERAIEFGYRLFDTGPNYAQGRTESQIAYSIKTSKIAREEFELSTKVVPMSLGKIESALLRSLDRLGTDYVDYYFLHWIEAEQRPEDFIEEFVQLREKYQIKNLGVSNFSANKLTAWLEAEQRLGVTREQRITCVQNRYNLIQRQAETMFPLLKSNNITFMAHQPFGAGSGIGETGPNNNQQPGKFWVDPRLEELGKIAQELETTTTELILAFLGQDENVILIPRSTRPSHIRTNFQSVNTIGKITEQVNKRINELFPKN
jgi:myo-inositol catabolism protein IolS